MNRTLTSLPVQELIRATERVIGFSTNHKGLPEEDFEAVLSCAHELIHDIKSSRAASQEVQICLLLCLHCRRVRDERETADDRWITKQTYQQSTGIDPTDCLMIHTYCPACYQYPKAA